MVSEIFYKDHFVTAMSVTGVWSEHDLQPEVSDDNIYTEAIDIFQCNACVNLCVATFGSFRENLKQPIMQCAGVR